MTGTGECQGSFGSSTVQVSTFRDQSPLDVPITSNATAREVLGAHGERSLYGALRNTRDRRY